MALRGSSNDHYSYTLQALRHDNSDVLPIRRSFDVVQVSTPTVWEGPRDLIGPRRHLKVR